MGICDGKVVIVTGAGRGIGRSHALAFAAEGAQVVVNDLGGGVDGSGATTGPAQDVVEEIRAMGGEAVANGDSVADFEGAERLVATAVDTFGRLDVLVNNAGILRDRMLTNMTEAEWDAVITVHLKGTFCPTRHAAAHWRERAKAGEAVSGRVINTTSASGIFGNPGQANYGAAKAGIAAFTIITAQELGRYGVTVNAIAPMARTRMTEDLGFMPETDDPATFDEFAPENMSPIVVWLGSDQAAHVSGRVFEVYGGHLGIVNGWDRAPARDKGDRWEPAELGPVVEELLAAAREPDPFLPPA
jgi:NAD(P)-dependent dehydrogenase (short-subunit alcohol dehydrogenase family)